MLAKDLEMCHAICQEICIDTFGANLSACSTYWELQPFLDEMLLDKLCELGD